MTVTTGSVAEAASGARAIRARGIRMIKVKVGGKLGPAHDLARIAAIHEVAPRLAADSRRQCGGFAGGRHGVGARAAGAGRGAPLCWSSGCQGRPRRRAGRWRPTAAGWWRRTKPVTTADDARRVVAAQAAQVINIKLMKGGLAEAFDIAAVGARGWARPDDRRQHRIDPGDDGVGVFRRGAGRLPFCGSGYARCSWRRIPLTAGTNSTAGESPSRTSPRAMAWCRDLGPRLAGRVNHETHETHEIAGQIFVCFRGPQA
jgi:hypothetical protein